MPKLVLADARKWAREFFLGDGDPKDYPQAAQKVKEHSFRVLTVHNTVEFEVEEYVSPEQVETLILAGWGIDIKPYK